MTNFKFIIYHNNRCSKSRTVLEVFKKKNIDFEIINYLKNPINLSFLHKVLLTLDNDISSVIRTNEKIFKKVYIHKKINFNIESVIKIVKEYPILLQRPIVAITKNNELIKSKICRPPELIYEFLK